MGLLNLTRIGRSAYLLAAAFALVAAWPAAAQTIIKFSLDGRLEGPEALLLLPQDRGYFKNEGLDLTVDDGATPLEPITRVANGSHEMAFADINALIKYRDQHPSAPVKAIFMVYNTPPYAVVARKSRGITEPKQLEKKKIGAPPTSATFAQWPLFAKLNNIDVSKVTIENIGIPVRAPMLAAGQIDAALGFSFRLYVNLEDRGVPVDDIVLMPMANYGLKFYGNAIVVNSKFAAEKPEAVMAFLRAFLTGTQGDDQAPGADRGPRRQTRRRGEKRRRARAPAHGHPGQYCHAGGEGHWPRRHRGRAARRVHRADRPSLHLQGQTQARGCLQRLVPAAGRQAQRELSGSGVVPPSIE